MLSVTSRIRLLIVSNFFKSSYFCKKYFSIVIDPSDEKGSKENINSHQFLKKVLDVNNDKRLLHITESINRILPSATVFKTLGIQKQTVINNLLQGFFLDDKSFYGYISINNSVKEIIHNFFQEELNHFVFLVMENFNIVVNSSKSWPSYIKYLMYLIIVDLVEVLKVVDSNLIVIVQLDNLLDILSFIDFELLFTHIMYSIARNSDDNLKLTHANLLYNLAELCYKYLVAFLLSHLKKTNLTLNCELTFLKLLAYYKGNKGISWSITRRLLQLSEKFLLFLTHSKSVLSNRSNVQVYLKMQIVYQLDPRFFDLKFLTFKLPSLIKPCIKSADNFTDSVKSIHSGQNAFVVSTECLAALNASESKSFQLDSIYITLLEELDDSDTKVDLPFKTKRQMELCIADLELCAKNLDIKNLVLVEQLSNKIDLLNIALLKKRFFTLQVALAKIFLGFILYYEESLDYRGRMYPTSIVFARTTGVYKYLVCDSASLDCTFSGITTMFKAYLSFDKKNLEHLMLELSLIANQDNFTLKSVRQKLIAFFSKIVIPYPVKGKKYLYFRLLGLHLRHSLTFNKTAFRIEIDQKSSASVFLSILLRHKSLALYSNVLGGGPYDIYTRLQSETATLFQLAGCDIQKLEVLYSFFSKNKEVHKTSFMHFCYGEQPYGRLKSYKNVLKLEGIVITPGIHIALNSLAKSYTVFIDKIFPTFLLRLDLLKSSVKFFLKKTKMLTIRTPDGSFITWAKFIKSATSTSVKDPITKTVKVFRVEQLSADTDTKKTLITFVSALIHSIDAAMVRKILHRLYKHNGYVVSHLHDSFQCHANYIDDLYAVIQSIYLEYEAQNFNLDFCFFEVALTYLQSEKDKRKFISFKKQLDKLGDFSSKEIKSFNAKSNYPFQV